MGLNHCSKEGSAEVAERVDASACSEDDAHAAERALTASEQLPEGSLVDGISYIVNDNQEGHPLLLAESAEVAERVDAPACSEDDTM